MKKKTYAVHYYEGKFCQAIEYFPVKLIKNKISDTNEEVFIPANPI